MAKNFRFFSFIAQLAGFIGSLLVAAVAKTFGMNQFALGMNVSASVMFIALALTVAAWVDENLL